MTNNEPLRLLLIEDDRESGESMKLMLARRDVQVTLAPSGEEALTCFSVDAYDVVVSDIRLQGMSGVEVLRHIRAINQHFPVILLTGYDSIESAIAALQEGAQDYILKPLDSIEQLLKPVRTAVNNHRLRLKREELERELEISERRFRKIYENAAVGVALLDTDGRFVQANQTARNCFHFLDQNISTLHLNDLITGSADRNQIREIFHQLSGIDQTAVPFECKTRRGIENDSFWCQWHFSRFENDADNQTRILAFLIDIDEKKQLESNLNKHREGLFQAEKLAAIGKLAGGIAHDFNNIMYIITGNLRLAMDRVEPGSFEHEKLVNALAACESAVDLTDRIRMSSQAGTSESKPVNIHSLIKQALDILSFRLPDKISLHTALNQTDAFVFGDRLELQQVLMNLFINATQAMPNGGILSIVQEDAQIDLESAERMELPKPGHYTVLTVRDTGTGISKENLVRIFEPFFSTKHNEGCSGLGLSLVYGIVKSHGGAITVTSEEGAGATFTVYLPLSEKETEATEGQQTIPSGTESIMIVDDDPNVLKTTEQTLQQLGYRTTVFFDCIQCLEDFRTNHGQYDMAIVDFVMPQMTGGQLSRELLNIRKDLPIIILTAFSYTASAKNPGNTGVYKYINKTISPADLAQTIRTVLDREKDHHAMPGKTILIIDDNNETRKMLRNLLEEASYRVVEAQNGRIGLEKFMTHHIDLVLTDLFMPEKDGLEVIMECKKNQPAIKIFAFTGGSGRIGWDCLALAAPLGADYTFREPIDHQLLLDKIYEYLTPSRP